MGTAGPREIDFLMIESPADKFRIALANIHPARAEQFWSWFRLCGTVYTLMEEAEEQWTVENGPVGSVQDASDSSVNVLPTGASSSRSASTNFPASFRSPDAHAILECFLRWSSRYSDYSKEENLHQVERSAGCRVSGFALLIRLLRNDNPGRTFLSDHVWDSEKEVFVPRYRQC